MCCTPRTPRMNRLYWTWIYAVTLLAFSAAAVHSLFDERRLLGEEVARASALATSLEDTVLRNLRTRRFGQIANTISRLRKQKRLLGLTICPVNAAAKGTTQQRAIGFPSGSGWESLCKSPMTQSAQKTRANVHWRATDMTNRFQYTAHAMADPDRPGIRAVAVVIQDLSYLRERWIDVFIGTAVLTWSVGAILLLLMATQVRGWVRSNVGLLRHNLKSMVAGRRPMVSSDFSGLSSELKPLSEEVGKLAARVISLSDAKLPSESSWLESLKKTIGGRSLLVIANREPYIHQRTIDSRFSYPRGRIHVIRPASGLVTALEPILRHTGGLWIAHGSGNADPEVVDANNEVRVPPERPTYSLRRVWLTKEQNTGYYYGFANEGLWPLCHLAHTRPIFRLSDWQKYREVNQLFCDAVPQERIDGDSLILVQDYHFAMLPRMLKQRKGPESRAKVGIFWHIPWPNAETFGICPWHQDLLRGMLGADVIGFHTQYHCNNFLDTCDRYLESRIDREHFSVTMDNHQTFIRAFPIGIDTAPVRVLSHEERVQLKEHYGIRAPIVAVGVDRLDYTKGLLERVEAVERFLEKYPQYVGKFTFVQMGSPSRTDIPSYRVLVEQLHEAVLRVNTRFTGPREQRSGYRPIVFLSQHHEWDEIKYFYQIGDLCMVTSLHDGMNLVAKEYVWCQAPDRGALILSKFTGASRELTEAFIVNPYSIEEMADAIAAAIAMPAEERQRRMTALREKVQSHNAYHWASDVIEALVRTEAPSAKPTEVAEMPGEAPKKAAG